MSHTAKPTRLLILSTSYPSSLKDWRGLFIRHLCDALARRDDLQVRLWAPPGERHPAISQATTADDDAWLGELMRLGGIAHLLRNGGLGGKLKALQLLGRLRQAYARHSDADLYHVNWLQNALVLPDNGKPVLISVLGTDMQLLGLPGIRPLLRRALRRHPALICPNADWMTPILERTFGDLARIRFVPLGIDPAWFAVPRHYESEPKAIWLVVSRLTRNKLGPLFDWGQPLFDRTQRELHLFGPQQEAIDIPAWVHYHGPASPAQLQTEWFGRAHGLITLSQHAEGRPQVMLEAMAAGLPIIASRLPAHEDILCHDETGYLCASPAEFADGLAHLEDPATNNAVGVAARAWVNREIGTWDDCAGRYASLYRDLLGTPHHG